MASKFFIKEDSQTRKNKHVICNICGCRQYFSNVARHRKSKKHNEVNHINNEIFEIKILILDLV